MMTFLAVAGGIVVANLVLMVIGFKLFTNKKIMKWMMNEYIECVKELGTVFEELEEKLSELLFFFREKYIVINEKIYLRGD